MVSVKHLCLRIKVRTTLTTGHQSLMSIIDQPRRGRGPGRPKKDVVVDHQEKMPVEAASRKRNRKNMSTDEIENEPATKRTRADEVNENLPPSPLNKTKRGRKAAIIAPRDQLPDRQGRNVNPVPKTAARRTSKEVQAAREAKEREIEKKVQELMRAKERLAEANIAEDAEIEAIDDKYPTHLSVALRKRRHADLDDVDKSGEIFDFCEVDEMSTSSEAEESEEVSFSIAKLGVVNL
jgi:hypothetical protein